MKIDINCDLGEGRGNDAELMPYLDSCNIACGGHFGDHKSMTTTIKLAIKYGVKLGAHPSFPDRQNFGRKLMNLSAEELQNSIHHQLVNFMSVCEELKVEMHHIKLHGALYNLVAKDPEIAAIVLNVFAEVKAEVRIYIPYQSVIAILAEDYFQIVYEAFIDRHYHRDLSLVSRADDNALITDLDEAWQQMSSIINEGQLISVEGDIVEIKADTFCLHGDEKNAVDLVRHIRQCLCR